MVDSHQSASYTKKLIQDTESRIIFPETQMFEQKSDIIPSKLKFTYSEATLTKYEIFHEFKKYGPINRCFIKNRDSDKKLKIGYVKFRRVCDAEDLMNKGIIYIRTHKIEIV